MQLDIDGVDLVNSIGVVPSTDICTDIEVLTDSGSITSYGLMEETLPADSNVKDAADMRAQGRQYIRLHKAPRWQVSLNTPDVPWDSPAYDIGDTVVVDADVGYATFNQAFRVMSWSVNVREGQELVALQLDSVGLS